MERSSRLGTVAWTAASLLLFAGGAYARLRAAYGPLDLGPRPEDWLVLWELLRAGQISGRVLLESGLLGLALGFLPWLVRDAARRHRR